MMKGLGYLLLGSLALSSYVFASPTNTQAHVKGQHRSYKDTYKDSIVYNRNRFEIIGAGGIAKLNAGNTRLGVTSSETDTLVQTNSSTWNTPAAQLGLGYIYYFSDSPADPNDVEWFPSIEPELNLYYLSSNSINGYVSRYNSSAFNEFSFDEPFHSTRIMLDVALSVISWQQLSLYGIAGVGNAWNRSSYSDELSTSADCTDQGVSLSNSTHSNFAWEAGAGLDYQFTQHIGLFLEYLYADLGTASPSNSGNTGSMAAVISAPQFHVKAQTALLGLHIGL